MVVGLIENIKKNLLNNGYRYGYSTGYTAQDYYQNINFLNHSSSALINLLSNSLSDNQDAMHALLEIKPYDLQFGTSLKETIKNYGRPNYSIDNSSKINDCTVVFYKKKVSTIKLVSQFHFYKKELFFARMDFSSNQSISMQSLNEKVVELVLKKYIGKTDFVNSKKLILNDNKENSIVVSLDNILPSINYITGNRPVKDTIVNHVELKRIEHSKKEKLNVDELFKTL